MGRNPNTWTSTKLWTDDLNENLVQGQVTQIGAEILMMSACWLKVGWPRRGRTCQAGPRTCRWYRLETGPPRL